MQTTATKNSYRVLLVDHNQEMYLTLKDILAEIKENDFKIDWVSDYSDAVETIHHKQHDLVFVDYQLDPERTGLDLLQEVNVSENNTPFILLNDQTNQTIDQQAIQCGAADYLTKSQLNKTFIERSIRYSIERQTLINQINQLAHFDALTDLPNRLSFDKALKRHVASAVRYERKAALLLIDIDYFKSINDNYGRETGDLLLQEISKRLRAGIRDGDFLARIDGNKYAIILNEIHKPHDAGTTAQNLCEAINKPFHLNNQIIKSSISVGIACFPNEVEQATDLVQCAEIALSRVKNKDRNSYQFYRRDFHEHHALRLSIENLLPDCIANNELYLTYQPIYDLNSNKIIGAETLVRWHCKKLNQDMPLDMFIPIAEENGLIHPIGRWVIQHACERLANWQRHGYKGFLTLNISPTQLFKVDFVDYLTQTLEKTQVGLDKIKIEVRETALISQTLVVQDSLEKLKQMGLDILVDRFGSSYASPKQLKELNINAIKIDKGLTQNIGETNTDSIIQALLAMANAMQLQVIAEGIETEQQRKQLIHWGCLLGQGYFYSKPLMSRQMTQYLRTHKELGDEVL